MDMQQKIRMFHRNLSALPAFELPDGFRFRGYSAGDSPRWIDLQKVVETHNPITEALYTRDFGSDEATLAKRQLFLLDDRDRVVGTSTAWSTRFRGKRIGQVHWVALHPEVQGRGLSKALLSITCRRMRELGERKALLFTSADRIPAIRLYLRFGFVPLIRKLDDEVIWQQLETRLERPLLESAEVDSAIVKVVRGLRSFAPGILAPLRKGALEMNQARRGQ